ncbi:CoA:oxalate CoA-transferase [Sphingomonas abietis]|uniref:CoA:oxalate CoA-transferase n=1 Tax=Sphingomonas abietis TaxID=3012344 RepID=A0ABY7NSK2_9SPHN|nr:CoA:oxalate CoA-transferase [Sphingomonas abietis]WBO24503.1 CoA:oxalate CoA-transferase [Sphingomonas abietis]
MTTSQTVDGARPRGPLSGVLVIDLTHVLNGPFGTALMADLGARVIKIEPPVHGDDTRSNPPYVGGKSLYFACVNRGKESIVLDLKAEEDRAIFLSMVKQADVLTENFRPGVMDRLGFSYEELAKINPRLVYASSSGFGHTGPLATFPAYDTVIQAMSGLMDATGFPGGPPTRVGTSISDLCAGTFMYAGITTALFERERSGKGAHVDIAMFDSTLAFMEHPFMAYAATGEGPERIGNRHPSMAPFDVFQAKDKPFVICCGNDHLFSLLANMLGLHELIDDPLFRTNDDRNRNEAALKTRLEAIFATQDAAHWLSAIHDAGVPVAPLLTVAEAATLEQTKVRNMVVEAGGMKMPGNPIKISGFPDSDRRTAAPDLDQHGASLRAEFGS